MSNTIVGVVRRSVNNGVGGANVRVRVRVRIGKRAGGGRRVGEPCVEGGRAVYRGWWIVPVEGVTRWG